MNEQRNENRMSSHLERDILPFAIILAYVLLHICLC